MPNINFNLEKGSIHKAIQELRDFFEESLDEEKYINGLLREAYEYATEHLLDLALYADTDMTKVVSKLEIQPYDPTTKRGALVLNGGEGADNVGFFVEFGTGVVGLAHQHPESYKAGWGYDDYGHGEAGWWYPTTEQDLNPYKWTDKEGQLRAWTKGMPSRPFMYDTMQWLKQQTGEEDVNIEFVVK